MALESGDLTSRCAARNLQCLEGALRVALLGGLWPLLLIGVAREQADRAIGEFVRNERFGRLSADLLGWNSARIAQDSVIWKPPGSGAVAYHQDAPYIAAQFAPLANNSLTVWNPLDPAGVANGVLEYVRGSHRWPCLAERASAFHGPQDYVSATSAPAPPDRHCVRPRGQFDARV